MSVHSTNLETPIVHDTTTVRHNLNTETTTQTQLHYPHDTWVGNQPPVTKPTNTICITFQNLNGVGTKYTAQNMSTIISEQMAIESVILGMTEHCINTNHKDIHNQIQTTIRQLIPEKVNLQINSCSKFQTDSPYLPGGTAISIIMNLIIEAAMRCWEGGHT
jgi:hypothetical protein